MSLFVVHRTNYVIGFDDIKIARSKILSEDNRIYVEEMSLKAFIKP